MNKNQIIYDPEAWLIERRWKIDREINPLNISDYQYAQSLREKADLWFLKFMQDNDDLEYLDFSLGITPPYSNRDYSTLFLKMFVKMKKNEIEETK
jgi:hypothetical protein